MAESKASKIYNYSLLSPVCLIQIGCLLLFAIFCVVRFYLLKRGKVLGKKGRQNGKEERQIGKEGRQNTSGENGSEQNDARGNDSENEVSAEEPNDILFIPYKLSLWRYIVFYIFIPAVFFATNTAATFLIQAMRIAFNSDDVAILEHFFPKDRHDLLWLTNGILGLNFCTKEMAEYWALTKTKSNTISKTSSSSGSNIVNVTPAHENIYGLRLGQSSHIKPYLLTPETCNHEETLFDNVAIIYRCLELYCNYLVIMLVVVWVWQKIGGDKIKLFVAYDQVEDCENADVVGVFSSCCVGGGNSAGKLTTSSSPHVNRDESNVSLGDVSADTRNVREKNEHDLFRTQEPNRRTCVDNAQVVKPTTKANTTMKSLLSLCKINKEQAVDSMDAVEMNEIIVAKKSQGREQLTRNSNSGHPLSGERSQSVQQAAQSSNLLEILVVDNDRPNLDDSDYRRANASQKKDIRDNSEITTTVHSFVFMTQRYVLSENRFIRVDTFEKSEIIMKELVMGNELTMSMRGDTEQEKKESDEEREEVTKTKESSNFFKERILFRNFQISERKPPLKKNSSEEEETPHLRNLLLSIYGPNRIILPDSNFLAIFTKNVLQISVLIIFGTSANHIGTGLVPFFFLYFVLTLAVYLIMSFIEWRGAVKTKKIIGQNSEVEVEVMFGVTDGEESHFINQKTSKIPISSLVPGDILVIKPHMRVPCDCVLVDLAMTLPAQTISVSVNEATLTGEARAIQKFPAKFEELVDLYTNKDLEKSLEVGMSFSKKSVLYSGVNVLNCSENAVALVLKTGSFTRHADLVKDMFAKKSQSATATNSTSRTFRTQKQAPSHQPSHAKTYQISHDLGTVLLISVLLNVPRMILCPLARASSSTDFWADRARLYDQLIFPFFGVVSPIWVVLVQNSVNQSAKYLENLYTKCADKALSMSISVQNAADILTASKIGVQCFDKTGTLTDSGLVLESVEGVDELLLKNYERCNDNDNAFGNPLELLHLATRECHTVVRVPKKGRKNSKKGRKNSEEMEFELLGNEVEVQMLKWSDAKSTQGTHSLHGRTVRKFEFDQHTQLQSVVVEIERQHAQLQNCNNTAKKQLCLFTKGSVRKVLAKCSQTSESNMTPEIKAKILNHAMRLSAEGFYTIAMACRMLESESKSSDEEANSTMAASRSELEKDLHFLGLLKFRNKVKPDSRETIQILKQAGIKVQIITGDTEHGGLYVARKTGLVFCEEHVCDENDVETEGDDGNALGCDSGVVIIENIATVKSGDGSAAINTGAGERARDGTKNAADASTADSKPKESISNDSKLESAQLDDGEERLDDGEEPESHAVAKYISKFTNQLDDNASDKNASPDKTDSRIVLQKDTDEDPERRLIQILLSSLENKLRNPHASIVNPEVNSVHSTAVIITGEAFMEMSTILEAQMEELYECLSTKTQNLETGSKSENLETEKAYFHPWVRALIDLSLSSTDSADSSASTTSRNLVKNISSLYLNHNVRVSPLSLLYPHIAVFGAMGPRMKLEAINFWHNGNYFPKNLVVGMCGDGGNDLGAIRAADIGICLANSDGHGDEASSDGGDDDDNDDQDNEDDHDNSVSDKAVASESEARDINRATSSQKSSPSNSANHNKTETSTIDETVLLSPFACRSRSPACVIAIIQAGRACMVTNMNVVKMLYVAGIGGLYYYPLLLLQGVEFSAGMQWVQYLVFANVFTGLIYQSIKPVGMVDWIVSLCLYDSDHDDNGENGTSSPDLRSDINVKSDINLGSEIELTRSKQRKRQDITQQKTIKTLTPILKYCNLPLTIQGIKKLRQKILPSETPATSLRNFWIWIECLLLYLVASGIAVLISYSPPTVFPGLFLDDDLKFSESHLNQNVGADSQNGSGSHTSSLSQKLSQKSSWYTSGVKDLPGPSDPSLSSVSSSGSSASGESAESQKVGIWNQKTEISNIDGGNEWNIQEWDIGWETTASLACLTNFMWIWWTCLFCILTVLFSFGGKFRKSLLSFNFRKENCGILFMLLFCAGFAIATIVVFLYMPNNHWNCLYRQNCDNRSSWARNIGAWRVFTGSTGMEPERKGLGPEILSPRAFFYYAESDSTDFDLLVKEYMQKSNDPVKKHRIQKIKNDLEMVKRVYDKSVWSGVNFSGNAGLNMSGNAGWQKEASSVLEPSSFEQRAYFSVLTNQSVSEDGEDQFPSFRWTEELQRDPQIMKLFQDLPNDDNTGEKGTADIDSDQDNTNKGKTEKDAKPSAKYDGMVELVKSRQLDKNSKDKNWKDIETAIPFISQVNSYGPTSRNLLKHAGFGCMMAIFPDINHKGSLFKYAKMLEKAYALDSIELTAETIQNSLKAPQCVVEAKMSASISVSANNSVEKNISNLKSKLNFICKSLVTASWKIDPKTGGRFYAWLAALQPLHDITAKKVATATENGSAISATESTAPDKKTQHYSTSCKLIPRCDVFQEKALGPEHSGYVKDYLGADPKADSSNPKSITKKRNVAVRIVPEKLLSTNSPNLYAVSYTNLSAVIGGSTFDDNDTFSYWTPGIYVDITYPIIFTTGLLVMALLLGAVVIWMQKMQEEPMNQMNLK